MMSGADGTCVTTPVFKRQRRLPAGPKSSTTKKDHSTHKKIACQNESVK
jgi:hypothetical protein